MKTLEQGSNAFTTWLGNATALPEEAIHPIFAVAIGYQVDGRWKLGRITFGRNESESLFYNALLYVRVMLPFWLGVQVRWAGREPLAKEYLQTGLGWKLIGRLGLLFRIQSDEASAAGVSGPNVGQADGWEYGTK